MNIKSAELLQSALENAAQNELRNRELTQTGQLERQRIAVENAFRAAQMAHYNQMENRQQGFYNKIQQEGEDRAELGEQNVARQQEQNALAQKQNALKTIMALNSTGQLTSDGLKKVNQWLSTDPDFSKTGIQLSAPANPSANPQHIQTALAQGLALRQQVQSAYDGENDPAKKAELGKQLEDIDSYFQGKDAGRMNAGGAATAPYRRSSGNGGRLAGGAATANRSAQTNPRFNGATSLPGQPQPQLQPQSSVAPVQTGGMSRQSGASADATALPADPRAIQWLSANPTPQNVAAFEGIYGQAARRRL
jgi:hypothetical protein